jgi:S1-C subfamily serine protease
MAAFYRGVAAGRMGSGFVVVAEGNAGTPQTYVVTNRHVVELASAVSLQLEDGAKVAASVAFVDTTYDLAVLIPERPFAPQGGFSLSIRPPHDGEPVRALGYPGLWGGRELRDPATVGGFVTGAGLALAFGNTETDAEVVATATSLVRARSLATGARSPIVFRAEVAQESTKALRFQLALDPAALSDVFTLLVHAN